MSYDVNECRFTGKVEGFTIVNTKTGTPMIRFRVCCNKEKVSIVAFKALADATRLFEGDQVSIVGALQQTAWADKDGIRRYGIQIIANSINGKQQEPFTSSHERPQSNQSRSPAQPYQGGPF
jgi:single-stranded DNA-binding protein